VSVAAAVLLDVMDLSGVFCVADSSVLQDAILWNSMGMYTCSVWLSNTMDDPTSGPKMPGALMLASADTNVPTKDAIAIGTEPCCHDDDDVQIASSNLSHHLIVITGYLTSPIGLNPTAHKATLTTSDPQAQSFKQFDCTHTSRSIWSQPNCKQKQQLASASHWTISPV